MPKVHFMDACRPNADGRQGSNHRNCENLAIDAARDAAQDATCEGRVWEKRTSMRARVLAIAVWTATAVGAFAIPYIPPPQPVYEAPIDRALANVQAMEGLEPV